VQVGISDFKDKQDLINCAMASAHIPMLLDMKFARLCRGKFCVDGSFPDFFYADNSELLKAGGSAVIFDYSTDTNLVRKGRMDMLSLKTYDEVQQCMQRGYEFAANLHKDGRFEHFEVGPVAKLAKDRGCPVPGLSQPCRRPLAAHRSQMTWETGPRGRRLARWRSTTWRSTCGGSRRRSSPPRTRPCSTRRPRRP
jgi:hypothetical protein